MPTTTLTTAELTLVKRTDVISTHLIIVGRGRQVRRPFTVPTGRIIRHYIEDNHTIDVNSGTLGLALRGRFQPRETHTVGCRIVDYTLVPTEEELARGAGTRNSDAQWHRHVDQSGRVPGAQFPFDVASLGEGVPCDIARLRLQSMARRLERKPPRLSQVLKNEILTQYAYIHCLFNRSSLDRHTGAAQAPLLID